MNRCFELALFLLVIAAVVPPRVRGHFFWAETNTNEDSDVNRVTAVFSEKAGVPDKVIARFEDRVTSMSMTYPGAIVPKTVALTMNDEKTLLEGDLTDSASASAPTSSGLYGHQPALVSGFLDFGPYEKFEDVRFSFGAQIYDSEADFEGFFRPLLKDVGDTPTIVMRNCGGSSSSSYHGTATASYQFDVAGFPSKGGPLGVCLFLKGGQPMGCGTFPSGAEKQKQRGHLETSVDRLRQLRGGDSDGDHEAGNGAASSRSERQKKPLTLKLSSSLVVSEQDESSSSLSSSPYLLYALANMTETDEASGNINIAFASTSVYFQGTCQEAV
mmetsp:Transcript_12824/g.26989  ORF Transcript_12824/g.26989 Transcript_12824/m.26989 type:complete len:329 (-) Transcript_12824:88-1074(-)|eukprot:CAMPEP_0168224318 /NCGR_PEP_ID=MMETSP0140_2-20121125/11963_1 /TAXON_ID=44445 /ORGANISM="Pseudo-nitzschia australis, Strain 10249 10 AB" /LENGTH=328 /DNA_ID=CAMNT_0008154625 /DNA_START=28 /DNA_END=1014 /DNA_ORIENTATION=-